MGIDNIARFFTDAYFDNLKLDAILFKKYNIREDAKDIQRKIFKMFNLYGGRGLNEISILIHDGNPLAITKINELFNPQTGILYKYMKECVFDITRLKKPFTGNYISGSNKGTNVTNLQLLIDISSNIRKAYNIANDADNKKASKLLKPAFILSMQMVEKYVEIITANT